MRAILRAVSMWLIVCAFAATASADDQKWRVFGRVTDRLNGEPIEGAIVVVAGQGVLLTATTDASGRYAIAVPVGTYKVVFSYGKSRGTGKVTVTAGRTQELNGRLVASEGDNEVIVIRDRLKPAVLPEPKNFVPSKAPPYSDRAVLSDAWTRAWLLLDIDEMGAVSRFKFLKQPGYDLEKIAASEVRKLRFDPARDAAGKPMAVLILWKIEWPSADWLVQMTGTRSTMPKLVGFPPRSQDAYVPCAGSGPMNLGSVRPAYKDCSEPDLSKAVTEPWIAR